MKRIASSPMEAEKKKQSGIDTSTPSTSPELHGPMPYAEAARSPRREIGPRPRRATVSTIPVPEEGHLAVTEGAIRNNFTVDVMKRNGQDFKGTLKRAEAFLSIFIGALGFPKEEFDGAILGFKGNPTVMFKTKSKFNIDERFAGLATFNYSKNVKTETGEVQTHTYECSIRGVRVPGEGAARANSRYTWVKIEGAEYQVPPAMIKKWLLQYGDLMTDLSEELEELEVSSDEEKELYTGTEMPTGVYSVQMLIKKPIPQFLPMDGKRIKVYHRGIKRICQNCFCSGHYRVNCSQERVDWMAYVDYFILESGFDSKEAEKAKKILLAKSRDSITKALEEQATASSMVEEGEDTVTVVESDEWEDANPPAEGTESENGGGVVEKMSLAVENMSVEELERELSIRKKGRPSHEDRKERALKKKELDKKKSNTAE